MVRRSIIEELNFNIILFSNWECWILNTYKYYITAGCKLQLETLVLIDTITAWNYYCWTLWLLNTTPLLDIVLLLESIIDGLNITAGHSYCWTFFTGWPFITDWHYITAGHFFCLKIISARYSITAEHFTNTLPCITDGHYITAEQFITAGHLHC